MLTAKSVQAYHFIRRYILRLNCSPSIGEIAEGIGIKSRGVTHRYVMALAEAGLIEFPAFKKRSIALNPNKSLPLATLPIIGSIAAGTPQNNRPSEETLDLSDLLLNEKIAVIQVNSERLLPYKICNGDYLIYELEHKLNSQNEIHLLLIDEEQLELAYLGDQSNEQISYQPIINKPSAPLLSIAADRATVLGAYRGILRLQQAINQ